ncbi:DeoR faimly transcriptional regulator [Flavobacterium sp. 316]|uniref:YafY family transcriptional regulator n=1 Tax=Flavobacterium sediminilitoris TaxID=2024526 RepID=A0ABY4HQ46_9FLAO|nr:MULTISPECIES: YafY family protein [Flavobacterium]KIX22423.1 DeoR faimly transcriptional regulator [Flavobacterium sp. 316]UOX33639.1 YafY family transcriptional regulator [Flavobacterium sediminilitoris]
MNENEKPRLSRLTSIVTQLQSKKILTAKTLAEKYNVSIRTIYRDIRTLEQSGIPIVTEEGKGYSLLEGYQLPPIMFTENEANALITAEKLISKNKDQSLVENYTNAIIKIKAVLRYSQKETTNLLTERIVFRTNIENKTTSNYLMTIQSAISKFQLMTIDYTSLQEEFTTRTIESFALYSTQENWILIAFCRLRNEFRAFRIDQIQKLKLHTETFEPHKMSLQEYFEICRKKYSSSPDIPLS